MDKIIFKKVHKKLYNPSTKNVEIVDVPLMNCARAQINRKSLELAELEGLGIIDREASKEVERKVKDWLSPHLFNKNNPVVRLL